MGIRIVYVCLGCRRDEAHFNATRFLVPFKPPETERLMVQ